jgi:hypothetical protein
MVPRFLKRVGNAVRNAAVGAAYQIAPGGRTFADAQREEEERSRRAQQQALQRQQQAQQAAQRAAARQQLTVAKPKPTPRITVAQPGVSPKIKLAGLPIAPMPTSTLQVKNNGPKIPVPAPPKDNSIPTKVRDFVVGAARDSVRMPATVAVSLAQKGASQGRTAQNSTIAQLQKLSYDERKRQIKEAGKQKNSGLALVLKNMGVDPNDPSDENLRAAMGRVVKKGSKASEGTYTPGSRVEKLIFGKEKVESYQKRRAGYEQALLDEKSPLFNTGKEGRAAGKRDAKQLSYVGIFLTAGLDAPGLGGPAKSAGQKLLKKLAKSKDPAAIKQALEEVGVSASEEAIGKVVNAKNSKQVAEALKGAPATAPADTVRLADSAADRKLKLAEGKQQLATRLSMPLDDRTPGLPDKPDNYFNTEKADMLAPIDMLRSIKSPEDNIQSSESAVGRMREALQGSADKRDPITVRQLPDGSYEVVDGNATLTAAQRLGWKQLPIKVDNELNDYTPDQIKGAFAVADRAKAIDKDFQGSMGEIAKSLGLNYMAGPVKSGKRILQKGVTDYAGDFNRVKDAVRGTIMLGNPDNFQDVVSRIGSQYEIMRIKNGYETASNGYKDVKVNVRLPDGSISELILATPEMIRAKEVLGGHQLYEEARVTVDRARLDELEQQMNRLYADADQAAARRIASSSDTSVPSTKALAGGNGLPEGITKPDAESPVYTTLTGVSSTEKNRTLSSIPTTIAEKEANSNIPLLPGEKERRFTDQLRTDELTPDELINAVPGYKPITNKETFAAATAQVDADPNSALTQILDMPKLENPTDIAKAQYLLRQAIESEDLGAAKALAQKLGVSATDIAQSLQIYAAYKRTTPEGALRDVLNRVEAANKNRKGNLIELTPEQQKNITDLAQQVQDVRQRNSQQLDDLRKAVDAMRAAEGLPAREAGNALQPGRTAGGSGGVVRLKDPSKMSPDLRAAENALASQEQRAAREIEVAEGQLERAKQEAVPAGLLDKVSLAQTIAQLGNPKTLIRNIVGNLGFGAIRNASDVVAAAIDAPLSLITKKRSAVLPSAKTQIKGFGRGLKLGAEDVKLNIDTSPLATQFDVPKGPVFQSKIGKAAEKGLAYALRVPDRAATEAAFQESLRNQMRAAQKTAGKNGKILTKPTDDMIERAIHEAAEATFQDDNAVSTMFSGIKKVLNAGKGFGLGDLVLKYPKTPGSLLDKGIKYSPLGFAKSVIELGRPLFGQPFDQREFVRSTAQALTGSTALVGTGALLAHLGIITGDPDEDKDMAALQKLQGISQYKINVSALKRFIASGGDPDESKLREGDKLVSYDWAQPAAVGLAVGANIAKNGGNVDTAIGQIAASLQEGANTLAEQPLITGLTRLFQYKSLPEGIAGAVASLPSSFVPTLFNQVSQLMDNRTRETYDPDWMKQAINQAKAKVPGVAQTLPVRADVWGKDAERFQNGTNNLFNVFFNPAFQSTYVTTPESKMVMDIYNSIGDKSGAPKIVDKSVTVEGEKRKLTAKEYNDLQRYVGTATQEMFKQLATDKSFQQLPDDQKAQRLSSLLTAIGQAGRSSVLGIALPKSASDQAKRVLGGNRTLTTAKNLPDGMSQQGADVLTRVSGLDAEAKKEFMADGKNEYAYKLAEYERDFKAGKLNTIQQFEKQLDLGKLKVQTTYPQPARDLYGLSKAELKQFIATNKVDKKDLDAMFKLDKELYDKGFIKSMKYEDGLSSAKGGKGKKVKAQKPRFGSFRLVNVPATMNTTGNDVLQSYGAAIAALPSMKIKLPPESESDIKIAL